MGVEIKRGPSGGSARTRIAALACAGLLGFATAVGVAGCFGSDDKEVTVTTTTGPVPTVANKGTESKKSSKPSICDHYPEICQYGSGKGGNP
jgi:hypothetical protein